MKQVFEIEKGIPYEPRKFRKPCNFPYAQMEIGDSFFVSTKKGSTVRKTQLRLSASIAQWRRLNAPEKKFKTSAQEDGVRVWRID